MLEVLLLFFLLFTVKKGEKKKRSGEAVQYLIASVYWFWKIPIFSRWQMVLGITKWSLG